MGEQVQHSYECQNLGCPNGHLSTFYAAPPEWFAAKNLSTPKGCRDCRTWIKEQTDSAYRCKVCAYPIRQSAKAKITHHKRKGVYTPPTECRRCELDRENGKKAILEPQEFESIDEEIRESNTFLTVLDKAGFEPPDYRNFTTDERAYDKPQRRGEPETRREHLEVHAPYTPGIERVGKKTTKTEFGGTEGGFSSYLRGISFLAAETHSECARERREGARIVKVNVQTRDTVVLRVEDSGPPPVYSAVTTFKADVSDFWR
jgi:hypothetical protein